jgi:arylsulfatase A-like enzyme
MQVPNIVLISLDTLRADVAYSGRLPRLHQLVKQGTSFRNAVSSAPLTPVSHASVFTGLWPYNHGVRHLFREKLNPAVPTLAQLAAGAGYETKAIVSCPGMNRWYGFDAGFYDFDDEIPRLADGSDPLQSVDVAVRGTALKRASLVLERSLAWLDTCGNAPFFLFLHFFDTHWPYEAPDTFGLAPRNPYEGEALYVDDHLGRFMDQMKARGLWERTLFVIFSDHGEDLNGWYQNDHGGPELGHPEERGHGCLLYDATQLVPLILIQDGIIPEGRTVETQIRLVDILPTITELAGIADSYDRDGQSLVPLLATEGQHRPAYMETYYREEFVGTNLAPLIGARLSPTQKIVTDLGSGDIQCFDLERDPCERRPVSFGPGWIGYD